MIDVDTRVSAAVARARAVQPAWAATPVQQRTAFARRFARLVLEEEAAILDVIQAETGKNRLSAFEEVLDTALLAAHYAGAAPALLRPRRHRGAVPVLTSTRSSVGARGVVALITPWNYPFTLPASDALPALVAGNAVVLKPDAATPRTAALLADLFALAGLPDGLLQIVAGPGPEVGAALIPRSDFVQFTGSTATGRLVAAQCGLHLVPFSAELGGKNALVVARDADVERAADGAVRACFSSSGQLCISIERIYVHAGVAEEFTAAFVSRVRAMRVAPGPDWDVAMGSLISLDHLEKVAAHVDDAVARGARVLTGGHRLPEVGELFYAPTVLTDVTADMLVVAEETFGPVVAITVTDSDADSVEAANEGEYGLNASVFSRAHGRELAAQLVAGSVNVNEGYAATWGSHAVSVGGWRASGLGSRHGADGLLKYTRTQVVAQQRVLPLGASDLLTGESYHALMAGAGRALAQVVSHLPGRSR